MKIKKALSALVLMLAMTTGACNGGGSSEAPKSSSAAPATSSAAPATSEEAPATSEEIPEPDAPTWPDECPAVIDTSSWTDGTPAANAYGKNYTPISGGGKVGVKININDFDPDSEASFSSGKLPTTPGATVVWKVKAPKAGIYQMIMKGKVSSSGDSSSLGSRHLYAKVNGFESQSNGYGDRMYDDAGLDHDNYNAFVVALVNLTGNEDAISLENPYYRVVFDMESDVVFAEN